MKIILTAVHYWRSRVLFFSRWTSALLSLCILGLPLGAGVALGYALGHQQQNALEDEVGDALRQRAAARQKELQDEKSDSERRLQALAVRMADLQARLVRLDALGERMADVAKLDNGEFNFAKAPPVGGPELPDSFYQLTQQDFFSAIDWLTQQVDSREQKFEALEDLLASRGHGEEALLGNVPVHKGWVSSYYGWRTDPFTGRRAKHEGVDFAGREGTAIIAVASGIVTWAGERSGYGRMIELNHGDGYATRYAHSKFLLVRAGDVVKKGQIIALMGSSGRSTAPHLHFEVYKHGRTVDPATYIQQASR